MDLNFTDISTTDFDKKKSKCAALNYSLDSINWYPQKKNQTIIAKK